MCLHHLLLQLLVEVKIRQHIKHGDHDLGVLLQELLERGDHGGVALVTDDLRERADDLLLQAGRGHGEHLHELVDEGVGVDKEIEPSELRHDEPPHVVLQRQSVERAAAAVVEVLGQLLEEQREKARLERGDGEESPREARRVRRCREEQLAEPRRGGGHEGGEALEEAPRGGRGGGGGGVPARGELAREAGREQVRRGEGRGLVRRDEERAARVGEQRRRRVDGGGRVGVGGPGGLGLERRGWALARVDGAGALQEHHRRRRSPRRRRVMASSRRHGDRVTDLTGSLGNFWGGFGGNEILAPWRRGSARRFGEQPQWQVGSYGLTFT